MPHIKTSEIEGCVMAMVWAEGPLTPYAIRKDFLNSPNPQWSGSAGTAYPLIARLRRRGWIRSEVKLQGRRKGSYISLTAAGRRALRRWLCAPLAEWVVGVPPDPLRTRVRFLGVLTPREQRQFLRAAKEGVQKHRALVERDWLWSYVPARRNNKFRKLQARGALLSMEARWAYVREVAHALNVSTRKPG
jgi:DNA-binding PadR family transcriptional regulator